MTSPFAKAMSERNVSTKSPMQDFKEPRSAFNNPLTSSPVFAPAVIKEVAALPVMSVEEIENTGAQAGKNLQAISNEVLKHQRANGGDEMTQRLNSLIKEAKQLDPNSMKNSRGITKIIKRIMGLKEDLFAQFDTVSGRIDILSKELEKDLKREKDGLIHLGRLKEGIKQYTINLHRDIELLNNNYTKETEYFQSLTEEQVDEKSEAQATLDLMETKIGDLSALRLLCVQMGPRIQGMEEVGKQLIRAGQNVIDTVIPAYCANFSMYVHSLRQKKSAQALNGTIEEFNTAIQMGGQLASENQIEATRLANRQIITIDTLRMDQERLLSTLEETHRINQAAREERVAYISEIGTLEDNMVAKVKEGFFKR